MLYVFLVGLYILIGLLFVEVIDDIDSYKDAILITILWPVLGLLYLIIIAIVVIKFNIKKK
jgi:membrane protein DedA with SNARE-associated domain